MYYFTVNQQKNYYTLFCDPFWLSSEKKLLRISKMKKKIIILILGFLLLLQIKFYIRSSISEISKFVVKRARIAPNKILHMVQYFDFRQICIQNLFVNYWIRSKSETSTDPFNYLESITWMKSDLVESYWILNFGQYIMYFSNKAILVELKLLILFFFPPLSNLSRNSYLFACQIVKEENSRYLYSITSYLNKKKNCFLKKNLHMVIYL